MAEGYRWANGEPAEAKHMELHLIRFRQNRRKTRIIASVSGSFAGFAMMSLCELSLSEETNEVPHIEVFLVAFAVCVTLVVLVHTFAFFISAYVMPKMASSYKTDRRIMQQIQGYIDFAWILSAGVGVLLFFVTVGVHAWIKFLPFNSFAAALISVCIVIPFTICAIIFAVIYHNSTVDLYGNEFDKIPPPTYELRNISLVE